MDYDTSTACNACGVAIHPNMVVSVSKDKVRCPHCEAVFTPAPEDIRSRSDPCVTCGFIPFALQWYRAYAHCRIASDSGCQPNVIYAVKCLHCSQIITIETGKRRGKPCIRGTRMTVYDVLRYMAAGMYLSRSSAIPYP